MPYSDGKLIGAVQAGWAGLLPQQQWQRRVVPGIPIQKSTLLSHEPPASSCASQADRIALRHSSGGGGAATPAEPASRRPSGGALPRSSAHAKVMLWDDSALEFEPPPVDPLILNGEQLEPS